LVDRASKLSHLHFLLGLSAVVKLAAAYLGFFLLIHLFLGRLKICRVIQFLECLQKILVNEGGNPNVMAPFSKLT
jgi:hypothetical protein